MEGLTIFNTETLCVETWNGTVWISVCGTPVYVSPTIPGCTSLAELPPTIWAAYNLGADPAYDTPKKQIKKLTELGAAAIAGGATVANYTSNAAAIDYQLNPTIFGDWYQWGRVKDGHQRRGYNGTTSVNVTTVNNGDYNAVTGQITSGNGLGMHVYNTSNSDWQDSHISYSQPQKNALWGNGQAITYNWGSAAGGAVRNNNGTFAQKPVKTNNDPCPTGWRVPTQDEWERLGAYQCGRANEAGGSFSTNSSSNSTVIGATAVPANNPNTTWVRVEGGMASSSTGLTSPDYNATGYAIYNSAVWNAADASYKNGYAFLYADAAPEPLLFLPAAGYRNRGNSGLNDVGYNGTYWSGSINSTDYAYDMYFSGNYVSMDDDILGRAHGFSVRCVKE
jgi:uncharacterized protein (TIGR02145 family)